MKKDCSKKINGEIKNKSIISLEQFDPKSLQTLFSTIEKIKKRIHKKGNFTPLLRTVTTLLFFEPSSRTFSSFSVAVKRLGGSTLEYQNPLQTSSVVKGETIEDTLHVFSNYSDLIIIRHPEKGTAQKAASLGLKTPIISAGDGIGEHPTQALMDMYTIYSHFGKLNNICGLFAGDLLYGRTVHSLIKGLAFYPNNHLYLLSPKELRLEPGLKKELSKSGIKITEIYDENDIPNNCQFWYWTRVQKERFNDLKQYEKVKNRFVITPRLVQKKGNNKMIIMHPLPRVGEIDTRIDSDPRAIYLTEQLQNGVYTRMALLSLVLGKL